MLGQVHNVELAEFFSAKFTFALSLCGIGPKNQNAELCGTTFSELRKLCVSQRPAFYGPNPTQFKIVAVKRAHLNSIDLLLFSWCKRHFAGGWNLHEIHPGNQLI